ncbi:hypothetical protein NA56DRAFT_752297 [Hyaloscypha hepaticicola]|uniref:Zn(2)-C6 fungal-type domain-containing protein n=1 Tax=Hyaloscypha hepaticicola TaxID=2082293 RepID=A0A2J6PTE9_9HELO|nr:hypothetical protein NA56DRAFT_752297 [Hyaloscypha hepaticicola]
MPLSGKMGHQVRKSRQSELPMIKFRSSCDLCTEAKVRCDKQHPQCERCIRIGSSCRYRVSMRTGKPTIDFVKALNAGMSKMPPQQRTAQTSNTRGAGAVDSRSLRSMLRAGQSHSSSRSMKSPTQSSSDSMPSPEDTGSFQDRDLSLDLDSGLPHSFSPFPAMPIAQNSKLSLESRHSTGFSSLGVMNLMDDLYTSADVVTIPGIESDSPDFQLSRFNPSPMDFNYFSQFDLSEAQPLWTNEIPTLSSISHTGNDNGLPLDPALLQQKQQPPPLQNEHSCLQTTKKLQQSVLALASRGEIIEPERDGAPPRITTTDQALLMCSSISKQLIKILQCRCEVDAHLPFLISVIISKLLAAYAAIAKVDDSTPFNSGSIQRLQKEQQEQEQEQEQEREQEQGKDAFVAVPLRLGAFEMDGELECVLRARLVLHELSKLECLVQLFAESYCQGEGAAGAGAGAGAGDNSSSNEGGIYSDLGRFVKLRFARTRAACELRSSLLSSLRV